MPIPGPPEDRELDAGSPPAGHPGVPGSHGVVTLLFTDLVGSTQLLERLGDDEAHEVVETHFRLLREAIARCGGREVKSLGDGVMVAFADPADAVRCAVSMQHTVAEENARSPDRSVQLRVGIHAGEPLRAPWLRSREEDFFGTAVVVAKRLCDEARGGQILASELVAALAGSRGDFGFRPLARRLVLKGIDQPVATVEVLSAASTPSPPLADVATAVPLAVRGPRLVDRERELALLVAELDRAAAGEFRCVLILGDPGVGKTRLAGELLARGRGRFLGLAARGYPLGEPASFGLWAEAVERHLRALPRERVAQLCGGFVDDLAGLLSSVAALRGTAPEREPVRARVLEGLLVLLGNLADTAPLLVVLDDVHCADASSWEVLAYLALNAGDAAIQVVAAARPVELAARPVATEVTLRLEQEGLLRRLEVGPLDQPSVAALAELVIGRPAPDVLAEWLAQRSGGNPLFALGLLQALLDEGADLEAPQLRSLPEPLADHVQARLRGLGDPANALMETLAVSGRRVRLHDLAFLTGRTPEELSPTLQALARSHLVAEAERDRELTYEIAHPLIQETVYQNIGRARRRSLHRVMGRALLASRRLGEAASHFSRSAGVGDAEAVEALCEALGQADRREAYDETVSILAALTEILPPGDDRWVRVADAMTAQADWAGFRGVDVGGGAIRALREIEAALERSPDLRRRAAAKLRLAGFLAWGAVELEEAERICGEAVELFEQAGDTTQMLLAANEVAQVHGLRGDLAAWEEGARRVAEDAETTGHPVAVARAFGGWGTAAFWQGRFAAAETAFRRCIAEAQGEGDLHRLTWAYSSLAMSLASEGRAQEAAGLLEQATMLTPGRRVASLLEHETCVQWVTGNFPAALTAAREAAALNPTAARGGALGMALGAISAIEVNQLPEASKHLNRCWAACGGRPWYFYAAVCAWADSRLRWAEGRLDEALTTLRAATTGLAAWRALPTLAFALLDLADLAAEIGDPVRAEEAVAMLGSAGTVVDRDLYRALAAIATAESRLLAGRPDDAAKTARSAVATLADMGYPAFLGRALVVLGRALAPGDRDSAPDALDRAEENLAAAGARWRLERLRRVRREPTSG